jgi:outer membrane protein TolC
MLGLCRGALPLGVAAILLGAPAGGSAQGLTLATAIRLADRHNEVPRIASARVTRARAMRREAYAALLPVLAGQGSYRRRAREVVREVAGTDVVISRNDAFSASARADIAIVDPTAFPRIAAAAHALDAAELDGREARRRLWLDVGEAFFSVLAAEQILVAAERRVEVAGVEAGAAARRLEVGLGDRNALTRAELEHAAARLAAVQTDNAVTRTRLALELLMGADVPAELVAPDAPVVEQLPYEAIVRDALEVRDDLRALRASVAAADALQDEPWTRLLPRLDGSAVFTWTNESGFSGNDTDWTIAITATWIAYDGGVRYAQASAREAELRELSLAADALLREVRIDVRTALADLASAAAAVEAAQARVDAADRNLSEVRARFEQGLADALAMADASEQAFLAAAALAGERLSLRLAELGLLRASGRWPSRPDAPEVG